MDGPGLVTVWRRQPRLGLLGLFDRSVCRSFFQFSATPRSDCTRFVERSHLHRLCHDPVAVVVKRRHDLQDISGLVRAEVEHVARVVLVGVDVEAAIGELEASTAD
jgi:hypothetical protein